MRIGWALVLGAALATGCATPAGAGGDDDLSFGHRDGGGGGDLNIGKCPGKDLQNDPMNCGFCGNVCMLAHTAMNACSGGKCKVGKCAAGFFDINNDGSDGCECQQAAVVTSSTMQCGGAAVAGTVTDAMPSTIDLTGNLVPANTSTWYQIISQDDPDADGSCNKYNLKIGFVDNPGKQFKFDLVYDDCSTPASCDNNEVPTGLTDYDFSANGAANGGECPCYNGTPAMGAHQCKDHSQTLRMRVYRDQGAPVTCDSYKIEITNGM